MSKFDLAVILVAVAGGALWIEQGHRIVIDAPAAEIASPAAAACPDNDTLPYSVSCIEFLNGTTEPRPRLQVIASLAPPEACPVSDRVPYSASCLAFLKGATETGMRWRVTEAPSPAIGPK